MQKVRLYSSKGIYAFAVVLCIAISVFIFCMSAEPATESAERSGGISSIVAPIIYPDFDEFDEQKQEQTLSDIDHVVRKIAHFCLYATVGLLFTFASLWHSRIWLLHLALPTLFGALYAASDEIHQMFVPGRGPLFSDVVLDSCGVLAGCLFMLALASIIMASCKVDNRTQLC